MRFTISSVAGFADQLHGPAACGHDRIHN